MFLMLHNPAVGSGVKPSDSPARGRCFYAAVRYIDAKSGRGPCVRHACAIAMCMRIDTGGFIRLLIVIFFLALLASRPVSAGVQAAPLISPLPVAETSLLLARWLAGSGFTVRQTASEAGGVRLDAVRGAERWRIIINPRSPLASALYAEHILNGLPVEDKNMDLRDVIDNYVKGRYPAGKGREGDIPEVVMSRTANVVCIRAAINNRAIQFSGFIVGKEGLVISTAHDLAGVREVVVVLDTGRELKGRLVKRDAGRDLSLIDTGTRLDSSISLAGARNVLNEGETVYSVGCPYNHRGRIVPGTVSGPLRRVNNHPLWQVDMETLPGGSGSPVFDAQGNLVGIVKGRYRGTESRGFFITMETLIGFLKDLQ